MYDLEFLNDTFFFVAFIEYLLTNTTDGQFYYYKYIIVYIPIYFIISDRKFNKITPLVM